MTHLRVSTCTGIMWFEFSTSFDCWNYDIHSPWYNDPRLCCTHLVTSHIEDYHTCRLWTCAKSIHLLLICMRSLAHVSLVSLVWSVTDVEIITGLEGSGPIFLDRLDCTPDDTSLLECRSFSVYSLGLPQCDHSQDVSIRCRGEYL